MALIVYDGLDHYAALADLQSRVGALNWTDYNSGGGGVLSFVTGFGGFGFAANVTAGPSGSTLGASINQNLAAVNYGCQLLCTDPHGSQGYIDFIAMDYTTSQAQVTARVLVASGTVLVYSGDPNLQSNPIPLAASAPNAAQPFVPLKYELTVHAGSSGSFNFAVQGTSVLSGGGNTAPSGNNWTNGLRVRAGVLSGTGGPAYDLDNVCVNDLTSGPGTYPFNGFVGDAAVRTLQVSGNSSVQWTPLSGANWQNVYAQQFDGDTAYNYATLNGKKDLFTFAALPSDVSVVFAVQVTGAYRKLDAGAQKIQQSLVSGGTTAALSQQSLSLGYGYFTDLQVLDPNTAATWTPAAVNAVVGGYTLIIP
jgi:hypothetical protein